MSKALETTDTVRRALAEAESWVSREVREDLGFWDDYEEPSRIDSPIEAAFSIWWRAVALTWRIRGCDEGLSLAPQRQVTVEDRAYRLDFAVEPGDIDPIFDNDRFGLGLREPLIAVELDGHDFHERTREQVVRRNQRDRDLQVSGWKIFHFSGSEVYQNGQVSAEDVFGHAAHEWAVFRRDVRDAKRLKGLV